MHGDESGVRMLRGDRAPAFLRHTSLRAEQRLCRCRAEGEDDARLHRADLGLEPWVTRANLRAVRRLVDPPFAPRVRRPLEVLHRVRDVRLLAVDAGAFEHAIQEPAGGTYERVSLTVFLVARLLTDDHHLGRRRALAEHGLRTDAPEKAPPAAGSRAAP